MRRISFVMFVVFACFASAPWLQAQGEFTSFDAPGAGTGPGQGTGPNQMTAAGTIVGNYVDSNFVTHGFVRTAQGEFATIDVPGARRTQALGMTQAMVVGFYRDTNRVRQGYVLGPDGKFVTFGAPGAGTSPGQGTLAAAINAAGTVSGMYWDANYVTHGFVRAADGSFATFDPPGSAYVIADTLGINSAGTVVEQYVDANSVGHGALRTADGTIVTFDAPHAGTGPGQGTFPEAINVTGMVSGNYVDSNNVREDTWIRTLCLTVSCAPLMARLSSSMRRGPWGQARLASPHRVRRRGHTPTRTLCLTALCVTRKGIVTNSSRSILRLLRT